MVDVTRVDFAGRRLETTGGPISYDFLVLAPGGETNFFGLDSMQHHGLGLKDIPYAIAIRNHVLTCFEQAMLDLDAERRRDGGCAVGADPAGAREGLSAAQHQGRAGPAARGDRSAAARSAGAAA